MALGPYLTTSLLHWAIILPVVLFLARGQERAIGKIAILFVAALSCDFTLYFGASVPLLDIGRWNWTGKFLASVVGLCFIYAMPWSEARSLLGRGIRAPVIKLSAVLITLLSIQVAAQLYYQSSAEFSLETIAFQATLPGISEEIVFRAMLQGGLNAVLVQRRRIWGVEVGWSMPLVALLFALGHGLYLDDNWLIQSDIRALADTFACGLLFGYLVALTSTIWWAVGGHNLFNVLGQAWQMAR
jgi:hypothetical protein